MVRLGFAAALVLMFLGGFFAVLQKDSPPKMVLDRATAQNGTGKLTPPEFVDRYNEQYLTEYPQLGSTILEVPGLDEEGNPFPVERIQGKYTVFVFGCLT